MEKIFGIGVVGCGGIANGVHLKQLKDVHGARIAALCDTNPEHLKSTAEQYGIDAAHCFADYRDLIACPDVDAVEVCTPNNVHCEIAEAALRAGKPVNVEKPVGLCAGQAEALRAVAAETGVPAMVCFSYRFMPAVRYARALIRQGKLGRIVSVYAQYLKSSAYMPGRRLDWRFDEKIARYGVSGDLAVHVIDMVQLLTGPVQSVCAQTGITVPARKRLDSEEIAPVTTDDYCHFLADLEGGVPAVFTVTRSAMGNQNHIIVDVYGEKGAFRFDLNHSDKIQVFYFDGEHTAPQSGDMETIDVPAEYFVQQEQTFVDLLHGRAPEMTPDLDDGVTSQRVLDALLTSAAARRWVDIGAR